MSGHRSHYDVMFYLPSATPLVVQPTRGSGATGGGETQVVLRARALAKRGVRVCLVVFPPRKGSSLELEGVDIVVRQPNRGHQRLVGRLREMFRIARALRSADSHLVVADIAGSQVGIVAIWSRLLRRRFGYSAQSLLDFDFSALGFRRRDLALYRLGLRLADVIVVQTHEQAEACVRASGREPIVIKSICEDVQQPAAAADAFLWAGRIDPNKQPMAYIDLAKSLDDVPFRMVAVPCAGHEALYEDVKVAAAAVPNLELLPAMPRSAFTQLIERAAAVVTTSMVEGMPNVLLEGWARGVPALVLQHDPDGVVARRGLGVAACGSKLRLAEGARRIWEARGDPAVAERCRSYVSSEHSERAVALRWEMLVRTAVNIAHDAPTVRADERGSA